MRGPKPKSTEQRRLDGNPGRRPLNEEEPQHDPIVVDTLPEALTTDAAAAAEWHRLAPLLRAARQITEADRAALIALCLEWARYLAALREVQLKGTVIAAPSGYPMLNPYLSVANKALAACNKLWPELGLTPSSRVRVKADGPPPGGDNFSEFDDAPEVTTH